MSDGGYERMLAAEAAAPPLPQELEEMRCVGLCSWSFRSVIGSGAGVVDGEEGGHGWLAATAEMRWWC